MDWLRRLQTGGARDELDVAAGVFEEHNFGVSGGLGAQQERVEAIPAQVTGPNGAIEELDLDLLADPTRKGLLRKKPAFFWLYGWERISLELRPCLTHKKNLRGKFGAAKSRKLSFISYSSTTIWKIQNPLIDAPAPDTGNLIPTGGL
jgi:hypothetical protein